MNRDIIEKSIIYEMLSEYIGKKKGTIKKRFNRNKKDIKSLDDIEKYIRRYKKS